MIDRFVSKQVGMARIDPVEALSLVQSIDDSTGELIFESALRDADTVEMTVRMANDPTRCFFIRYWCSDVVLFETDGGFVDFRFCETDGDSYEGDLQELESCFGELVDVGFAYLTQHPEPRGRSFPSIALTTAAGDVRLHRSLSTDVRQLFGRHRTGEAK